MKTVVVIAAKRAGHRSAYVDVFKMSLQGWDAGRDGLGLVVPGRSAKARGRPHDAEVSRKPWDGRAVTV